jgi:hypothetical protein
VLRLEGFLLADEKPFVPGSSASVGGACGHKVSSAIPPSASLCREHITLCRVISLAPNRDWPLLAQSGRSAKLDPNPSSAACARSGLESRHSYGFDPERSFASMPDSEARQYPLWTSFPLAGLSKAAIGLGAQA